MLNLLTIFFNYSSSKVLKKRILGKPDIIFARNVLAHVTYPNEIFKGVKEVLSKKGVFVIEVPHLLPIMKNLQYDNIFHEHQGFHTLKSIKDLCDQNDLKVSNVQSNKFSGWFNKM